MALCDIRWNRNSCSAHLAYQPIFFVIWKILRNAVDIFREIDSIFPHIEIFVAFNFFIHFLSIASLLYILLYRYHISIPSLQPPIPNPYSFTGMLTLTIVPLLGFPEIVIEPLRK